MATKPAPRKAAAAVGSDESGTQLADFVLEGQGDLRRWLLLGLVSALESDLKKLHESAAELGAHRERIEADEGLSHLQQATAQGWTMVHLVLRTGLDGREVEPSLTALTVDEVMGQFGALAGALRTRQCELLIRQGAGQASVLARRLFLERALLGWLALETIRSQSEPLRLVLESRVEADTGRVELLLQRLPGQGLMKVPAAGGVREELAGGADAAPPALEFLRDLAAEWAGRVSYVRPAATAWTITISLPLAPQAAAVETENEAEQRGLRVLLLERDVEEGQRFLETVYAKGSSGVAVSNAESAMRMIQETNVPFDLLVCDEAALTAEGTKLYRMVRGASPSTELVLTRPETQEGEAAASPRWRTLRRPYAADEIGSLLEDVKLERSGPARVLIIGDEPVVRRLAKGLLEEEGHEVVECPSAMAAWDELRGGGFDLAVVDWSCLRHGDWQGRHRPEAGQRTRVLALLDRPADWYTATYSLGADAVIPKPVEPQALRAQIRSLLGAGLRSGSVESPVD